MSNTWAWKFWITWTRWKTCWDKISLFISCRRSLKTNIVTICVSSFVRSVSDKCHVFLWWIYSNPYSLWAKRGVDNTRQIGYLQAIMSKCHILGCDAVGSGINSPKFRWDLSSGLDGNMRTCCHEKNLNLADWGGPCKPGGTSASVLYRRKHAHFRGNTGASLVAGKEGGWPASACWQNWNVFMSCEQNNSMQADSASAENVAKSSF